MFAATSLLMIVAVVVGTVLIQAPFFRQSIIDREASMVRDLANALASQHGISGEDMQDYANAQARKRLDAGFNALKKLAGTERVRVFNRDNVVVWTDDDSIQVGTKRLTHLERLSLASSGQVQAVFNSVGSDINLDEHEASMRQSIECYVPIYSHEADSPATVIGVLALYRDPRDLNRTISHGLYLLWAVAGAAGLVLFVMLYHLFNLVYRRQQTAESKFSKLTLEHERIVQIEKMSAMGEVVGEIAHQLNNPLVGVINLAQLAQRKIDDPKRVSELLDEVRKAGTECRDIVQRILRINQVSRSELQPTDIGELVQDTIAFCQHSIDAKHLVDYAEPAKKHVLDVDPVLMRQALFNLIHNAVLAGPGRPVRVAVSEARREGADGVLVSVTDAGPGFTAETAAKLFKPFFTTRSNGTGLGLPVAQHIAMKHGGAVLAENLSAGGACFSIWLPIMAKA